jgi:uncharacterized protein YndB with AHSA1/START domain
MAKPFKVELEMELEGTPEQVWEAIATGPGLDGWWMGTNEIEPRQGGTARTAFPNFTMESRITAWDPPHRLVTDSGEGDDGRQMALEFAIEGRPDGTSVLRFLHHGFLPDETWEAETRALSEGDTAYVQKLQEYIKYFRGRKATPIAAFGPVVDRDRAWAVFKRELGLGGAVRKGDPVRFSPEGLPVIDGVVDYVSNDFLGVRTDDGLYRFIHGFGGAVVLGHHIFSNVDAHATEQAWQAWVDHAFA